MLLCSGTRIGQVHIAHGQAPGCQPGGVSDGDASGPLRLHRWRDPAILVLAGFTFAAGFSQFGVVAALGDVARSFGEVRAGDTITDQAGLSGTAIGTGLAVIRLASLLALPVAALADRFGRRRTLRWCAALGLGLTALASLSPTYAVFVAVFAFGRPFISATDTVAGMAAAEQTATGDRARALAVVAAAYGVGAGLVAVLRGLLGAGLGFRAVLALALVPLAGLAVVGRFVTETDRYRVQAAATAAGEARPVPVLGAVAPRFRRRLVALVAIMAAISAVTGPANSFFFLYVENVLGLSSVATATMVVGAGVAGLGGLLLGRVGADRLGRRPTVALAVVLLPAAGILTYSGSVAAAVGGYLAAVLVGAAFLPAIGALQAELFPTSVRAAVAGWLLAASVLGAFVGLLAFGLVADAGDRFGAAAVVVFAPVALSALAVGLVPETRDRELEDAR